MPPPLSATATSLVPSLDEATDCQETQAGGLLPLLQVIPESVDVKIPPYRLFVTPTATSLVPSLDEATDFQEPPGATLLLLQTSCSADDNPKTVRMKHRRSIAILSRSRAQTFFRAWVELYLSWGTELGINTRQPKFKEYGSEGKSAV